jgi:hypothetical protein
VDRNPTWPDTDQPLHHTQPHPRRITGTTKELGNRVLQGCRCPFCRSAKAATTDTVSATSAEILTAKRVITELERLRDELPAPGAGGGDGR